MFTFNMYDMYVSMIIDKYRSDNHDAYLPKIRVLANMARDLYQKKSRASGIDRIIESSTERNALLKIVNIPIIFQCVVMFITFYKKIFNNFF